MSPRIKQHYHTKVTPIGLLSRTRVTRSGLGPTFTPAHSAFGFPIYVAPLPAGSIQRVCQDTLEWLISLTHDLPSYFALAGYPVRLADSQSARFSLDKCGFGPRL